MLLTGVDNHRTGIATIPEVRRPEDRDKPGYSMSLEPGVMTVADRLKAVGYRTYMTGKWHLGRGEGELPNSHGFDRSFALGASGADNWEQKPYMPYYSYAPWFEDGEPVDLPEDFYSSEFMIDKMIDYLDKGAKEDSPFLAYIAFQAIHISVQAPREFVDHYEGVFDDGWQALRAARWQRAQALGLIPQGAALAPMPETARDWDSLSEDDKRLFAKSMAVNAGMLEAMDFHIGRLVAYLKASGELDNTIFVIASDNGPEPSDPVHAPGMALWMWLNGYQYNIETLGERGSLSFIGPEWANAAAAPGDLFKFYAAQGGIHVPLIISGPGIGPQSRVESFAMVTDITPTILDYADIETVSTDPISINGRSLRPVLSGAAEGTYGAQTPVGLEVAGNSALFLGDHKITRNTLPYGDGKWRLYNLATDPGETTDTSAAEPQRFQAMLEDYNAYAAEFGVLEMGEDFNLITQLTVNVLSKQVALYWWQLLLAGVLILGAVATASRFAWRKIRRHG